MHADIVSEVARSAAIGADEIALHLVAGRTAVDPHAILVVTGDDVAGSGARSADGVALGRDSYAIEAIAEVQSARGVGADEVALHQVTRRWSLEVDAVSAVAGDDVARGGGRAAEAGALFHRLRQHR